MPDYQSPNLIARDGALLVMSDGARTSARCLICNRPVQDAPIKVPVRCDKSGGGSDEVSLVVALATSRSATVHVYCCPAHQPRKNPIVVVLAVLLFAGFGMFLSVMMQLEGITRWLYPLGFGGGIGLILAFARKLPVKAVRIEDGKVWVSGAGIAFLQSLPTYQPARK